MFKSQSYSKWQAMLKQLISDNCASRLTNTDSDGNPAINVYCYYGENASLGMHVSEANMSDGMSADGCNVTFHVLADGGYQFNIEYDGKRYEIECADFECNPPEMRYFDPNE